MSAHRNVNSIVITFVQPLYSLGVSICLGRDPVFTYTDVTQARMANGPAALKRVGI